MLDKLIQASGLEELTGERVENLVFIRHPETNEDGSQKTSISLNQRMTRAGGTASGTRVQGAPNTRTQRSRVKVTNGADVLTGREFVAKYGTKEIHENSLVAYNSVTGEFGGNWPTKPVFIDNSIENAKATFGETWSIVAAEAPAEAPTA